MLIRTFSVKKMLFILSCLIFVFIFLCPSSSCTPDTDGDGFSDNKDNCPNVYNPYQTDADGDGIGDGCDNLKSCLEIKNLRGDVVPAPTSGQYTIDPDGDTGPTLPFTVYCDMVTDGGGWTLIMKAIKDNFPYDDPLWTNSTLFNDKNFDFTTEGQKSKYMSFSTVSFTEIRTSDPIDFNKYYSYKLTKTYNSALELFSGIGIQIGTTMVSYFNDRTPADGQQWGCTTYINVGINQKQYLGTTALPGGSYCDWNGGARFGQRINAYHGGTGNHAGQGWGAYSTIDPNRPANLENYKIKELLWVR